MTVADADTADMTPDANHANMPALDDSASRVSVFEFWPMWLFYLPIFFYIGWLCIKYRGLTVLTAANPTLPFAGLVGESKQRVLDQVKGDSRDLIAPYTRIERSAGPRGPLQCFEVAKTEKAKLSLDYPLVLKPDVGMRGAGVQVAQSDEDLWRYICAFPAGGAFLMQYCIPHIGEAGVFYVREPGEAQGRITSLTLKYFPFVTGDGSSSLRDLITQDPRAGGLLHLYEERLGDRLNDILEEGSTLRLAFAGNHCRGTLFRNGTLYITEAMTKAFDDIAHNIEGFYIGRFDVRFADFADLQSGKNFMILEINGAGGESTHIWDSRMSLLGAWRVLMAQYDMIFRIGAANRKQGHKPDSLMNIYKAWRRELQLSAHYPHTH